MASVNSTTTSATLLNVNSSRKGAAICNTDANPLYVLLGSGTASATNLSYTVQSGGTLEIPAGFTGEVVGVWAADGSGYAHVTTY